MGNESFLDEYVSETFANADRLEFDIEQSDGEKLELFPDCEVLDVRFVKR